MLHQTIEQILADSMLCPEDVEITRGFMHLKEQGLIGGAHQFQRHLLTHGFALSMMRQKTYLDFISLIHSAIQ